ncbi:hypothetical protein [Serinicoccus chungangensis]|nr:hypothetical protein [Serinicoccus chungangensis]
MCEFAHGDVSAYSGKTRPQYQYMLAAIGLGESDAVMVFAADL